MEELAEQAPEDVIIFDEAAYQLPGGDAHITPKQGGQFFQTRGGSLGVGIPARSACRWPTPARL